ncbi:MAG: hypothetical protein K6T17_05270 [Fimbriimonadales bacterium]|nr:hypothetical protein [Fimbriimonadales bacterium]
MPGPIVVLLIAGWFFVIGSLIRCDPLLGWMERVSAEARGEGQGPKFYYDDSKDPLRGHPVSLPSKDVFGRALLRGKGDILLVMGGSCQSCAVKTLREQMAPLLAEWEGKVVEVVFALEGEREEVLKSSGDLRELRVVVDDRKWSEGLNVAWTPRVYLLDKDFRVVSFQREPSGALVPAPETKEVKE